jgi:hypothetical protein
LERDKDIRIVCGISKDKIPSHDAMCQFLKKLVGHADLLEKCFTDLVKESHQLLPGLGPSSSWIAQTLRPIQMVTVRIHRIRKLVGEPSGPATTLGLRRKISNVTCITGLATNYIW